MKMKKLFVDKIIGLAPMAGVTNSVYRTICSEYGSGINVTEMISDKGLLYENKKTFDMIKLEKTPTPLALQLFGASEITLTDAAKLVMQYAKPDIIDVNMGCPVNKVIKSGAGSSLLKEPQKVYDIVKSLKDNIDIPITIKIRAGFDHQHINCDAVAKKAVKAGVDAITIHGRTRSDMYHGQVNLEYIKMVRENADCYVFGNGDVSDGLSAKKMFEETSVDGIMIGRAAMGNPWIFKEVKSYLKGEEYNKPTKEEIIMAMLDHAKRLIAIDTERYAMIQMRTHAAWYFKQLPMSKKYRSEVVLISTYQDLERIALNYLSEENKYI